ncbi:lipase 3-like [Periplaneta americana]|uniref:lipase 3-like n=1 Tax=Periplaneta americana TaxID=6978 RepID=UPI0037E9B05E
MRYKSALLLNFRQPELLSKYGYPVEEHEVETEDGYLLTLHRIPSKDPDTNSTKGPVLVQHGLLCSSIDYVILGPGKALAYLLSDAGYDVWLGNARGNVYSRKHVEFETTDKEFWQFSWNEIGIYDLPAMIDYILNVTSESSLYYVGHSQGTTSFYVMGSEMPEYNEKIRLMVSLSPVAFMSHMKSPAMRLISPIGELSKDLLNMIGGMEFKPRSELTVMFGQIVCNHEAITRAICSNFLFLLCGFNSDQLNETALPVILSHIPAGASTKQCLHYGQLIMSGKFAKFDFGQDNEFEYDQDTPPDYDLSQVTAATVLMFSDNDWLSDVQDVDILHSKLSNVVLKYRIPDDMFNHLDYLYAKDVNTLVYEKVLELLSEY